MFASASNGTLTSFFILLNTIFCQSPVDPNQPYCLCPASSTLPTGPGCHLSPAAALVPAPTVPQACLPLILSPGTLSSCTSLGHVLLPCAGRHSPALLPPPECPGCLPSAVGPCQPVRWWPGSLAATHLGNAALLLLLPDTFHADALSQFNPATRARQLLAHPSPSPQWDGEEKWTKSKLVGWDKDSLVLKQRKC